MASNNKKTKFLTIHQKMKKKKNLNFKSIMIKTAAARMKRSG
jgi:hypothetical protein